VRPAAGAKRRTDRKAYAEGGSIPAHFSRHSLRYGILTSAAARGASLFKMMDVTRHKSVDVLRGYVVSGVVTPPFRRGGDG
jgi:hypothetical protein